MAVNYITGVYHGFWLHFSTKPCSIVKIKLLIVFFIDSEDFFQHNFFASFSKHSTVEVFISVYTLPIKSFENFRFQITLNIWLPNIHCKQKKRWCKTINPPISNQSPLLQTNISSLKLRLTLWSNYDHWRKS